MALPTIPSSNCWTKADDGIATALASLPAVHHFIGVTNETDARAGNLFIDAIPPPADGESYTETEWASYLPRILVGGPGDQDAYTLRHVASSSFNPNGIVELIFEKQITKGDAQDIANQERCFKNQVGDVLEAVVDTIHTHWLFHFVSVIEYGRADPDEDFEFGVLQRAVVSIPWGSEAATED